MVLEVGGRIQLMFHRPRITQVSPYITITYLGGFYNRYYGLRAGNDMYYELSARVSYGFVLSTLLSQYNNGLKLSDVTSTRSAPCLSRHAIALLDMNMSRLFRSRLGRRVGRL